MSRPNSVSLRRWHRHVTVRGVRALLPLLACLVCLGLSACGTSGATQEASVPQRAIVRKGELKSVKLLVRCLRQHGFNLPEPKSAGLVSLRGFDPNAPGYKTAVAVCLKRVPPPKSSSTAP